MPPAWSLAISSSKSFVLIALSSSTIRSDSGETPSRHTLTPMSGPSLVVADSTQDVQVVAEVDDVGIGPPARVQQVLLPRVPAA